MKKRNLIAVLMSVVLATSTTAAMPGFAAADAGSLETWGGWETIPGEGSARLHKDTRQHDLHFLFRKSLQFS